MSEASQLPAEYLNRPNRLIRIKEVQYRTGLGRSTIYRWMAKGEFPRPIKLGGYAVAWSEMDIETWILTRNAAP